ncbi:MAG: 50S ribosomal protein L10 [Patescibacteria group bacterium]
MTKRPINPQKSSRVALLASLVAKAKSIGVVDYTKMTPPQATELRKSVQLAGGEVKVEKNTLFRIALQSSNAHCSLLNAQLRGLSAFIFSNSDEISALKVVSDFIKKNSVLSFKMGFVGDRVLTQNDIVLLAQTPSRDISVGKLLYLLNFNMSKLVRTLDAVTKITHPA